MADHVTAQANMKNVRYVMERKWVSVKDKFPEKEGRYLVSDGEDVCMHSWYLDFGSSENPGSHFYPICEDGHCDYILFDNGRMTITHGRMTITHWAFLPDLPEKE